MIKNIELKIITLYYNIFSKNNRKKGIITIEKINLK